MRDPKVTPEQSGNSESHLPNHSFAQLLITSVSHPHRFLNFCFLAGLVGLFVYLAITALFPEYGIQCYRQAIDGLPCPDCGLGRSLAAMLRGDVASAGIMHTSGPGIFYALLSQLLLRAGLFFPLRRNAPPAWIGWVDAGVTGITLACFVVFV